MAEIQKRWISHLRNDSHQESADRSLSCPLCSADIQPDFDAFRAHVLADEPKHKTLTADADIEEAFRKMSIHAHKQRPGSTSPNSVATNPSQSRRRRAVSRHLDEKESVTERANQHERPAQPELAALPSTTALRPTRSPPSSLAPGSSPPTTPGRSQKRSGVVSDFDRGEVAKNAAGRQLWRPPDEPTSRSSRPRGSARRSRHANRPASLDQNDGTTAHPADVSASPNFVLFRQPDTKPITQEQLISEVKGIYEGLRLVEAKCIELNSGSDKIPADQKLNEEQYQKLIGLHRTLLHEHHDFFLASQHPAANAAMRRLPAKYNMPARMWRHGIQSFLEFLRRRLPDSLEYMLTFIYIAYSTMTLLYETVPGFVATWIECLGDLGRYRMAIEDEDPRDRDTWTCMSRYWYSRASDRLPTVGRLYHHLAILARPDALQQLFYYNKSLCVPMPFLSAWDSIMTLFDPVLNKTTRIDRHDAAFVRVHAILFTGKCRDQLEPSMKEFLGSIDQRIAERHKDWMHPGYYIGISLVCSIMGYGATTNPLKLSLPVVEAESGGTPPTPAPASTKNVVDKALAQQTFEEALSFTAQTCDLVLRRKLDCNVLAFFHTIMVFLWYTAQHPKAISLIEEKIPWERVVGMLNEAHPVLVSKPRMTHKEFPRPPPNEPLRPLPEDYAMRGLAMSQNYFPENWFSSQKLEDDEKMFEPPSLADERRQRVLWLGRKIAGMGPWITWDDDLGNFFTGPSSD